MKKIDFSIVSVVLLIVIVGCSKKLTKSIDLMLDNGILAKMYQKDHEIRELDAKTDTVNLENYDKVHRNKVLELLANNQVVTPMDKYRAALILQHTAAKICDGEITSTSLENFLLAYHLSSSAFNQLVLKNDTLTIKKYNVPRMIALNYDRYLLFKNGYQKFGTQFVFDDKTQEMMLAPVDSTLSNDEERKKYNVEPLKSLFSKYKMRSMPKGF